MLHQRLALKPRSVSEILKASKALLEGHFDSVMLFGEVGSLTYAASGHVYFTLKDSLAEIRCVMYKSIAKNQIQIQKGMVLVANGKITLYESRGEYQMQIHSIGLHDSIGERNRVLELLKDELRKKGYFDESRKRKLPTFPQSIALITSSQGAVVHDMQTVAMKRWKALRLVLIPTIVQGANAAVDIAANIAFADGLCVDIIILARGGGSVEDLWVFNERIVVEAIIASKTPIVSAIGHEVDSPLSDYVADLRAPTPSAAMEMILPDEAEWLMRLDTMQLNLYQSFKNRFEAYHHTVQKLHSYFEHYNKRFKLQRDILRHIHKRLNVAMKAFLESKQQKHKQMHLGYHSAFFVYVQSRQKQLSFKKQQLQTMQMRIAPKEHYLTSCKQQLERVIAQIVQLHKKRLHNLHIALEWYNQDSIYQKGWVQLWHNDKLTSLRDVHEGDELLLSDREYKAIVRLQRKLPKGEENV